SSNLVHSGIRSAALGLVAALMLAVVAHAQGDPPSPLDAIQLSPVSMELLPALQRASDVGGASPDQVLHIAVSLTFAHPSDVQSFRTTIRAYALAPRDGVEPSRFVAYSTPIQLPSTIAPLVVDVSGLETYTRPQPRVTLLTPTLTRGLYDTAGMFAAGFTGTG